MKCDSYSCSKCNILKCKAECCVGVPLNSKFIEEHQKFLQRPVFGFGDSFEKDGVIYGKCVTHIEKITPELHEKMKQDGIDISKYPLGDLFIDVYKQVCPFLKSNHKCAVYSTRPAICKAYGTKTEEDNPLTCHYHLGKNYHFPKTGTPEHAKINNIKYAIRDLITNKELFNEMYPNENHRKELLKILNITEKV